MSKKTRCRVLVTGNSRSGSTWFCKVLRKAGLDVRHEYMGADGTVSCYFFRRTSRYPFTPSSHPAGKIAHQGERHADFKFDVKIHLVREPLKSIGSIWSTMQTQHQLWLEEFKIIPSGLKPKFLKSMHTWHAVNLECEALCDHRITLEDIRNSYGWPQLCRWLAIPQQPMPDVPPLNKSRGMFLAKIVRWQDMAAMDIELCVKIAKMSRRYGYKTPTVPVLRRLARI